METLHRSADQNRPVGGSIVAVIGQEVVVQFPEDVKRDATIWCGDIVICLTEHGIEVIDGEVLGQEFVTQTVAFNHTVQLLEKK